MGQRLCQAGVRGRGAPRSKKGRQSSWKPRQVLRAHSCSAGPTSALCLQTRASKPLTYTVEGVWCTLGRAAVERRQRANSLIHWIAIGSCRRARRWRTGDLSGTSSTFILGNHDPDRRTQCAFVHVCARTRCCPVHLATRRTLEGRSAGQRFPATIISQ